MSLSPTAAPTSTDEGTQQSSSSSQIGLFGLILGSLVGSLILYCGVYVYCHRRLRVIQVHQPLFLILICFGMFVWAMGVVPISLDFAVLSQEGANHACMASQWLTTMGYTIAFSALFAKLYRINQLFHCPRFQRVTLKAKDVMKPLIVLFSINFFLLLSWTLVDPLQWNTNPEAGDALDTYRYCESEQTGFIIGWIIALINNIALVLVCIQAWKARDISIEFNESKYLAIGLFNWLQLQLVALPTQIALNNEDTDATYLLQASTLLMQILSMLLVLFVPIFRQVKEHHRRQQERDTTTSPNTTTTSALPLSGGGQIHVSGLPANRNSPPHGASMSGMTDVVEQQNGDDHKCESNGTEVTTTTTH